MTFVITLSQHAQITLDLTDRISNAHDDDDKEMLYEIQAVIKEATITEDGQAVLEADGEIIELLQEWL